MKRILLLIASSLAMTANAQTSEQADKPSSDASNVAVRVFKAAELKKTSSSHHLKPIGREGWGYLNMMIDPKGRPYEIAVVDSNGDEKLNSAIVGDVSQWQFQPATDEGEPIHSSFSTKFTVRMSGSSGARKEFFALYQKLGVAINANDRENASATLASMRTERLYEDAYLNFAKYIYAAKWGTENEQIEALRRAIAYETQDRLLPADMYKTALAALLPLQAKTSDLSGALDTWQILQTLKLTDNEKQRLKNIVEQIEAIRNSDQLIAISGEISSYSSWYITLFKRKFQVDISIGKIDEIKLRCEKKYVFFPFNADLYYEISPAAGKCHLELIGSPGTKFNLLQS